MLSPDTAFDLLTVAEICEILHISKAHACNLISGRVKGCERLPAIHMGRRLLVRRESLLEWIRASERGNGKLESSPERGRRKSA
jgi:excisionase family DNA binding protein